MIGTTVRSGTPGEALLRRAAALVVEAGGPLGRDEARAARRCVGHALACALQGSRTPWGRAVQTMATRRPSPTGGATLVGTRTAVVPEAAVFANSVLAQSTLAEDVHPASLVHPGSLVVPAALAAAEEHGATGELFLAAVVVGYDVLCALATALRTPSFVARGLRPSAVFGPVGAAAATAVVLGLDDEQTISALAMAIGTGAGSREWAHAGTTDVYAQNGFAARNGYVAAHLARAGLTGPASVLDGRAGLVSSLDADTVDWDRASRLLRRGAALAEVQVKRYAACSAVQGVLQLAQHVHHVHQLHPDDIESVVVETHRHGVANPGCDRTGPCDSVGQAQMSNQVGVSLALHGAPLDLASYARHDEDSVVALSRRVEVREDAEFTARFPARVSARLTLRARGRQTSDRLDASTPLRGSEVDDQVRAGLSGAWGGAAAEAVIGALAALPNAADLEMLSGALRTRARESAAGPRR